MWKKMVHWALRTSGVEEFVFHSVFIERQVIQTIVEFAKRAHPNEFTAYLQGRITNRVLYVKGILYEHYHATENQAVISTNLPLLHEVVGTVHSHPSMSNLPSSVDKRGLFKMGLVNIIICQLYSFGRVAMYDGNARPLDFTIVEQVKAQ